jgi:hypothetical protein
MINNRTKKGIRSNKYKKSGFANLNNCILQLSKIPEKSIPDQNFKSQ